MNGIIVNSRGFDMDISEELQNHFNVHDNLKTKTVDELRTINIQSRLPFAVCAWNVDGNLNIGMMIRTACNLGAERFIVIGRRRYDKRSCVGSNHYFPIETETAYDFETKQYDVKKFYEIMNRFNYTPVILETNGKSILDDTYNMYFFSGARTKKPCLIFGSESEGLPKELMESKDIHRYRIPQLGVIRSYNVSAAAAIAMWEFIKEAL